MNSNVNNIGSIKYSRVLLKVSGEALMGNKSFGCDLEVIEKLSHDIKLVGSFGIQICLVVGGGNIFRGATASSSLGFERASNDYIGMLATVMNSLSLQNSLEKINVDSRVLSAMPMHSICETYIRRRAIRHLEKGRVVICAAGIGSPFFTTDTAAALRGIEMRCDAIFKGTQVDGVYSSDPKKDSNAVRYTHISYLDLLASDLKIMDIAALSLARENSVPIIVFNLNKSNAFADVIRGKGLYTTISD
ncbi:UMP kinase [Neoehrlichia mikurensis]|uniref:Uridylate kinase n=1 Tax=Neoehrlichia mikurensis TaxID=89586 RepID=A0A9Q9F496_9RICK|nr:UMP kinase [Neoehrlichia mikurensis]QXK91693.1 UMP kinase [Neoehrlichia mikurensis]QXK92904.1 UMP kinase [Neoehrlichia mikurensis]QXK93384.1 UMP kinase [Neoehrlichia mikurensis]UTO55668.1 UMP kinase [Neoehrlichia mikurensis]UTO56588.1 UMP kinase [Neoehrlichia mikurensis]